MKYHVSVNDCAGLFCEQKVDGFEACVALVVEFTRKYPGKVVCPSNLDRCDYDTDGLTEDERDALDEATFAAVRS